MVFENKSLYLYIIIFNNELISIFTKDILLKYIDDLYILKLIYKLYYKILI